MTHWGCMTYRELSGDARKKKDPNGKPSGSISYEKTISRLQAMFFSYRLVEVSLTMILFVVLAQT